VLYTPYLPAERWLARYACFFPTVEVNATFYRLPLPETVRTWTERVPADFAFACKGSRFLTHMKRLRDVEEGVRRFFAPLRRLGPQLRVVLWQLPPQMDRADPERLDRFLAVLPRTVRHAVEFRHAAWHVPEVLGVLEAHGAALCEHDLLPRARRLPDATFRYLRLHGSTARYAGRYGEGHLRRVADDLRDWRRAGGSAYVYFNNDAGGAAIHDAVTLQHLLAGAAAEKRSA
jgi:uncharacterized protein YecE (DUF72 family)